MRSADPLSASSADTTRSQHDNDLAAGRRVLSLAGEAIAALGETLNGEFSRAIDTILAVQGRVIVSGMGKSGHIARKIAATLASTGTPAYFIHPAEASHGDLGMVTRDDVLIMLSNSGETQELSDLITFAKRFSIPLIGIASKAESALLQAADIALLLPKSTEACPMGLAPTTSTTMQLVLGDALAVALMERRGFTHDRYRDLHPGGSLGKGLIRVSDIMHQDAELPLVAPDAAMRDVVITMTSGGVGFAGIAGVVDEDGALVGIITDGDVRRHIERDLLGRKARDVMTPNPKTIGPDLLAAEALAVMNASPKVTCLFVVRPNMAIKSPIGLLTVHDCLRAGLQ
jgi:arabinose-5-phosphate isomerase